MAKGPFRGRGRGEIRVEYEFTFPNTIPVSNVLFSCLHKLSTSPRKSAIWVTKPHFHITFGTKISPSFLLSDEEPSSPKIWLPNLPGLPLRVRSEITNHFPKAYTVKFNTMTIINTSKRLSFRQKKKKKIEISTWRLNSMLAKTWFPRDDYYRPDLAPFSVFDLH